MQISFNVFFLPFPPSLSLFLPVYLVWCFVLLVAGFLFLLLLFFFGKLRFHLNAARQKVCQLFPSPRKKLADAFYDTFIRFRLSVDVAGFVSSSVALLRLLLMLMMVLLLVLGSRFSVLGSGFWFGFLSVA